MHDNDAQTMSEDAPMHYLYFLEAEGAQQENPQMAIHLYLKCIETNDEFYKAYKNLGTLLVNQGAYIKAIPYIQKYLSTKGSRDQEAYNSLGIAYSQSGNLPAARRCFHLSLLINPRYSSGYYNLGVTLQKYEIYDEAHRSFLACIDLDDESIDAYNHIALLEQRFGNYGGAQSALQTCLQIDQNHLPSLKSLADLYRHTDKLKEALQIYLKIEALGVKQADLFYYIGLIYLINDEKIKSLPYLQEAFEMRQDASARYQIGVELARNYSYLLENVYQELRNLLKTKCILLNLDCQNMKKFFQTRNKLDFYFINAIKLYRQLFQQAPSIEQRQDINVCYFKTLNNFLVYCLRLGYLQSILKAIKLNGFHRLPMSEQYQQTLKILINIVKQFNMYYDKKALLYRKIKQKQENGTNIKRKKLIMKIKKVKNKQKMKKQKIKQKIIIIQRKPSWNLRRRIAKKHIFLSKVKRFNRFLSNHPTIKLANLQS